MTVKIHSELKSQDKAREQVVTITFQYYGLNIVSVFHGQGAPEGRWAEESDCLTRKDFWVQIFSYNKSEKFLNPELKCYSLHRGDGMQLTWGVLWSCHSWQLFIPGERHLQTTLQLPPCSCSCPSGCGDPQQEDKPLYPQLLCSRLVQDQRSLCLLWPLIHILLSFSLL